MRELEHLRHMLGKMTRTEKYVRLEEILDSIYRTIEQLSQGDGGIITLQQRVSELASIGMIPVAFDDCSGGMKIDREIARDTECPQCGKKMLYQAFKSSDGQLGASVAYCPDDYASISF